MACSGRSSSFLRPRGARIRDCGAQQMLRILTALPLSVPTATHSHQTRSWPTAAPSPPTRPHWSGPRTTTKSLRTTPGTSPGSPHQSARESGAGFDNQPLRPSTGCSTSAPIPSRPRPGRSPQLPAWTIPVPLACSAPMKSPCYASSPQRSPPDPICEQGPNRDHPRGPWRPPHPAGSRSCRAEARHGDVTDPFLPARSAPHRLRDGFDRTLVELGTAA